MTPLDSLITSRTNVVLEKEMKNEKEMGCFLSFWCVVSRMIRRFFFVVLVVTWREFPDRLWFGVRRRIFDLATSPLHNMRALICDGLQVLSLRFWLLFSETFLTKISCTILVAVNAIRNKITFDVLFLVKKIGFNFKQKRSFIEQ